MEKEILLPGLDEQIKFLTESTKIEDSTTIVFGSESAVLAECLFSYTQNTIQVIVEDYDSLINSRMQVKEPEKIDIRLMDFERTDFNDNSADLVFAQASVSDIRRNKIIKEIKRILKPGGLLCTGEIIKLKKHIPVFVSNIFSGSQLDPLFIDELENYYLERKFEVINKKNLSHTLTEYYSTAFEKLNNALPNLSDKEKSYYKKVLNKISHESNAYLKNGADKFIGFYALLMKRN